MFYYVAIIISALILERITINALCRNAKSREFIKHCIFMHPNAISIMRIPQGLISMIFAYYGHWGAATMWFAFWMISDLTDGTIARHCQLETETGKWLDPLSDKCMNFPALLFFCFSSQVSVKLEAIPALIYIAIDIFGQASRLFVRKKAANLFGKGKTAMITILLAGLALNQIDSLSIMTPRVANVLMYACIILAALSCYCKIVPDNWYANTLTLANFVCGIVGIYHASQHHYILSLVFVFIGQFFDLYDGRLARKFGSTKRGALFDDIADATSFGLAIGMIIFNGLRYGESGRTIINTPVAAIITLFYLACLIYRLYRFIKPTKSMPKGIFQGMPSPAGAMLAGSALLAAHEIDLTAAYITAAIIVIAASSLMISNVPYSHFGQTIWTYWPRFAKMIFFIFVIIITVFAIALKHYRASFIWICFGFALFYVFYGIQFVNKLKAPELSEE